MAVMGKSHATRAPEVGNSTVLSSSDIDEEKLSRRARPPSPPPWACRSLAPTTALYASRVARVSSVSIAAGRPVSSLRFSMLLRACPDELWVREQAEAARRQKSSKEEAPNVVPTHF